MSTPMLQMNVDQIKKMIDEYQNALDSNVEDVTKRFGQKIKEAIEASGTRNQDISRMTGIYEMAIKNLRQGEIGHGVGLGSAIKILTHLGYNVELTLSKRS